MLWNKPDKLVRFKAAVESVGYKVQVIVALREVTSYLPSIYWELTKHGLTLSWDDFMGEVQQTSLFSFNGWDFCFNYPWITEGFGAIFGVENINVIPYNPISMELHFLRQLGFNLSQLVPKLSLIPRRNCRN